MTLTEILLVVPLLLAWLYLAFGHGIFWRTDIRIENKTDSLQKWPQVAVVIPARNEAESLPGTFAPILKQDYPGEFSVTLVNDHSTDGTLAIAQKAIAESKNKNARVLEAQALASGWTGKLWALDQGIKSAGAPDYYLFTDADIYHPEHSLKDLVLKAEAEGLGMVSLMVKLSAESFWEKVLIPAFVFFFQKLYPFAWSNDPKSKTAAAAGGCILIRRSALEKIGGLHSIRSQLIDDCSLARRVKDSGEKIWIGLTETVLSLRRYDTLEPIWTMVSRTAYTQLKYSPFLLLGTLCGMSWLYLLAPILFFVGLAKDNSYLICAGAGVFYIMMMVYRSMVRFYRIAPFYRLTLPVSALLYALMTFHSAWKHYKGAGGEWKGRTYS